MQIVKMKTKLEEKIKALEEEKHTLLEERDKLKEILELSEKAKTLETEVNKLREEIKSLRDKIPEEILEELGKTVPEILSDEKEKEKKNAAKRTKRKNFCRTLEAHLKHQTFNKLFITISNCDLCNLCYFGNFPLGLSLPG